MPRTTIDLDATVLEELRQAGAASGKSMGEVASELLAAALAVRDRSAVGRFAWTARELGRPRIDLEDREAVRRALGADR